MTDLLAGPLVELAPRSRGIRSLALSTDAVWMSTLATVAGVLYPAAG